MVPAPQRHSWLARQVGTLALAHVQVANPMARVRAAAWHNTLHRFSVHLPLFVVHDLGLLLTTPRGTAGLRIAPRAAILDGLGLFHDVRKLLAAYQSFLETVAASEVVEKASSWHLRDELVAMLLTKVLGDLYHRWGDVTKSVGAEPLPLDPQTYQDADVAQHFRDFDPLPLWSFLRFVVANQLHLYTCVEQIDLDTLRLLGVFSGGLGGASGGAAALDLVDLYGVFQSAEANDIVNFSLDLLPSVLETKRASGVQSFSVDGYASIERRGNVDSLVLSEFAYDEDLFERKVIDDELYYYGHEKQREAERRLEYILVDSSPSMRGVRQVFARGLALTLAKKLALEGDEVWIRFFDSRLYDTQKVTTTDFAAPYLLCFRSDRGRNYGKVFRQLLLELTRLRRDEKRRIVVYIVTHGQCHLPVELVDQLRKVAFLYGIFILPSSDMALEYLGALDRHQIVDAAALSSREGRKGRALDIIQDATEQKKGPTAPATKRRTAPSVSAVKKPLVESDKPPRDDLT